MKVCAACHEDLPKESYSKKQWKIDQRRCKVCITNNREVQPISPKQDNNDPNTSEIIKSLDCMCMEYAEKKINVEKKINDEELFKQPPPAEDCPICFLRMPSLDTGWRYQTCCGKQICSGCVYAPVYDDQGNEVDNRKCPFCRVLYPTSDEVVVMLKKRIDADDAIATYTLGYYYSEGTYGFPQEYEKALELYNRAGELGHAKAYNDIGHAYYDGKGVEVDKKKMKYYWELSAMGGYAEARHNIGVEEEIAGNIDRALKHYMIAVRAGDNDSLMEIQDLYSSGHATKEDYTKALRAYQEYLDEIKSPQRDAVAATYEDCLYY